MLNGREASKRQNPGGGETSVDTRERWRWKEDNMEEN